MEIYYFTYTGTSKEIAEWLGERFSIKPREVKSYKFPYVIWLALSFIPYFSVKAYFEPPSKETIIFCFPKWTFNCPPATYFLKKINCKKLILIISYKGWGEDFYKHLYFRLLHKRVKELKIHFVKRKLWEAGIYPEIEI